jgi:hypothetical protein
MERERKREKREEIKNQYYSFIKKIFKGIVLALTVLLKRKAYLRIYMHTFSY